MSSSEPEVTPSTVLHQIETTSEFRILADLAGIQAPGKTMEILFELVGMGIPPREVHNLLRDVLASRSRSRRVGGKNSSRRSVQSSETIQENTAPET